MKNANEPAMPVGEKWRETIGGNTRVMSKSSLHAGLTKREMFAMHAMQALATNTGYGAWQDMANDAVNIADALLAELEKTSDN
jgi:hypothetical protein